MFNLSSKLIYALIGLIYILQNNKNKPISIFQISRQEKISKIYLERIFHLLVKNKILKSIKGSKGGFILNTRIEEINLLKLVKILNTKKEKELLFKNKSTEKILLNLQILINKEMEKMLKGIKLSELLKKE